MDYITPQQMAEAEERASRMGVSVEILMENAGRAIAEEVVRRFSPRTVLVVTGTGNNGGDGLVAARHLSTMDVDTLAVLLGNPGMIKTASARTNFERLKTETHASVHLGNDVETLWTHSAQFEEAEVILDAIFGTGIRGEVREPMAEAIRMINRSKAVKVAIDVPSGLDPLTGAFANEIVRADLTITLHRAKVGLKGRSEYTGEIVVVPIGIPA